MLVHSLPAAEQLFAELRNWRTEIARPTKTPAFMILWRRRPPRHRQRAPQNLTALHAVSGMGPTKVDRYGADLIAICRGNLIPPASPSKSQPPQPSPRPQPTQPQQMPLSSRPNAERSEAAAERPAVSPQHTSAVHPNKRPTPPPPAPELTPTQLALESRLKDWRREAAKAAGLPSFFIFSDTVLRNITLAAPTSLETLSNVRGVAPEKLDTFGPTILTLCQA